MTTGITWHLKAQFARGVREDRPILFAAFVLWTGMMVLLASQGVIGVRLDSYLTNLLFYAATAVFFIVPIGAAALFRARPDSPIRFLLAEFSRADVAGRFARGAPMLIALIVFMPAFSAMKSAIPLFNSYTWDATFIAADRALHGGDPWRLLYFALGYPWITATLALMYHLWVLQIYLGGVFFCFFVRDRTLRSRYFVAYFAIWSVIGIAMATAFASVGPCFVGPLLGNDYYRDQMTYLYFADSQVPVMVLAVQEQLLHWHLTGNHGLGRGITAMPSMHVALALLFALAVGKCSKALGRAFMVFFLVVMVGSVHLAYHYALDGYVSIAATVILWRLAGAVAHRMERRAPSGVDAAPPAAALS